jgi:hypothetical protein
MHRVMWRGDGGTGWLAACACGALTTGTTEFSAEDAMRRHVEGLDQPFAIRRDDPTPAAGREEE